MTADVVTGYPDWQRTTRVTGVNKLFVNQVIGGVAFASGRIFVGDYGYLTLAVQGEALANHYMVQIYGSVDATGTRYPILQEFVTVPGAGSALQYPIPTPYVDIAVTNIEGTADTAFIMDVYATNYYAPIMRTTQPGHPLVTFAGSVNAASAVELDVGTLFIGRAQLRGRHISNNSWHIEVDYWDPGSKSWIDIFFLNSPAATTEATAEIPMIGAPMRLLVGNDDTVARTMHATLTAFE